MPDFSLPSLPFKRKGEVRRKEEQEVIAYGAVTCPACGWGVFTILHKAHKCFHCSNVFVAERIQL